MGGGGKGGSTTVQKMEIPPEVLARYNAVNARAETVAQRPYQAYSQDPNAFVAPLTATQQAGIQNTNYMAGAAQPYYGVGAALTGMGAQSVQPGALNVGQYYNPFTQAVAAPTLAALQQQQAVERSSLMNPQTARSFGGDRSGIVGANLARQQDLATAQAMAPIYQKAFSDALGTAQQQQQVGLTAAQADMNRLLQAGAQYGQLGTGAQQAGLAGAQAQLAAGQAEQQTQQAGLQALYNQFQQQQAYPFQVAQFLANIAMGTGALSGNTTTSTTTGGGGFFSDERLKENIQKVGETNDGQNIYRYNYKGDPRTQIGLLAQEVAREHPEAVGEQNGYLTVDYRDATKDAARDRKADGGSEMGTDIYDIDAPSAMLSGPMVSGLGAAGPFAGAQGLPIQAGAINPAAAGLLAPKATGFSPGTIEGAQAQLATLKGGKPAWSGEGYQDWKVKQLEDFLAGAQSQGGLVSGPGAFSRGGYAEAGYVNPALVYYSPVAAKGGLGGGAGPYGAALTPAQVQALKAPEIVKPQQQKSGLAQAAETGAALASLGKAGKGAYDWGKEQYDKATRYDWDAYNAKLPENAGADAAHSMKDIMEGKLIDLTSTYYQGGLVRDGYALQGGTPYGTDEENDPLGKALTQPLQKVEMMTPKNPAPKSAQGPSPAAEIGQAAGLAKAGKGLYDWGAGKLAGDATGAAGQLVNVGSATSTGLVPAAGEAATGLLGAGEAATGLLGAGEAAGAALGAGEALAGGAALAEGAGLLGTAAAAGEGIMAALPFLAFLSDERMKHDIQQVGRLNDGQPVYRFKYDGDDKTRMGLMAQDVERSHPEAVGGLGGMKMVDYKRATQVAAGLGQRQGFQQAGFVEGEEGGLVPFPQPVPGREQIAPEEGSTRAHREVFAPEVAPVPPADIPAKPRMQRSLGDIPPRPEPGLFEEGLGRDIKDFATSESFIIPALAGIGSMLASRNPTLGGAIGEGLVGGTTAYTNLQKQSADVLKQRFDIAKNVFKGPTMVTDENGSRWVWEDARDGSLLDQGEYQRRFNEFITGKGSSRAAPSTGLTTEPPRTSVPSSGTPTRTARDVVSEPAPKVEPRTQTATTTTSEVVEPAKPETTTPAATQPSTPNVAVMRQQALENTSLWANTDPAMNPRVLLPQVKRLDDEVKRLETEANQKNEIATRAGERNPDQAKLFQGQATNLLAQAERLRKERDDKLARAQKALDDAVLLQTKEAEGRQSQTIQREFKEEITPTGEKVLLPPGTTMPPAAAPKPTPEQEAAPKKATVDEKTGQLVLARPVAPAGGGLIQSNLPPGTKVTEMAPAQKAQTEDDAKFIEDFRTKGYSVSKARQHYYGLITAFKMFESGSTEGKLAGLGAIMQSFGYTDLAQKVASGDPAAVQFAEKIAPDLVLETLKAANPRFAQSEFTVVNEKGVPEPNKLPEVNFQMVKNGLAYLNRIEAFAQAWQRASQEEGWRSPSAYYAEWSKANPLTAFEQAAERQMGNFRGMNLPSADKWTPGTIYVVPKNLSTTKDPRTGISQAEGFARMGLKPGSPFRYNGPNAEQAITPVDPKTLFSITAVSQ